MSTIKKQTKTPSAKAMAERVEFDVIAARGEREFRIWTSGDIVNWKEHEGEKVFGVGAIPRPLFLLASRVLAERCESEAHGDDWDTISSELLAAASENMEQPVVQAMAWPHGSDPWDNNRDAVEEVSDGKDFGFDYSAVATSLDTPPNVLKPPSGD